MSTRWIVISCLLFATACGGGAETEKSPGASPGAGAPARGSETARPWDPARGTATVTGRVRFVGKAPKRKKIPMNTEPACDARHKGGALSETVIVNADGTLKNVFVRVEKGLEAWTFTAPTEPVHLDQQGCTYVPHVIGIQAGQPLEVKNGDPVSHNIHAFGRRNPGFNFSQASGSDDRRTFKRPEIMVKIKCDIHGWMGSWVGVVKHPFFAVTGDDGTFSLAKLPPGEYEIEAWHEKYGKRSQTVTVGDGETKTIEFEFSPKKR